MAGAPAVVCDREDADLIADDDVDDAERETSCDEPPLAMTPYRAEAWILQENTDGVLKLREEGLR